MTVRTATKKDWKTFDMPELHDSFILDRLIDEKQMSVLEKGNIPQEMEDKWFWYMEGHTLYAYRSWTGFCIYIIEFSKEGHHKVTVNRDPKQYACTSTEEDKTNLSNLLDWWSKDNYDYYNEWLFETAQALKNTDA